MEVSTLCPASCGELLQGIIGDSEKLISYGIDRFTSIVIKEEKRIHRPANLIKCFNAIDETLNYFNEDKKILKEINIYKDSQIPIAKGMASSTADMAASVVGFCKMIDKKITEEELGKICAKIEPTDSTIFKKLTLFDHLNGRKVKSFSWSPKAKVLVLEPSHILTTQRFRKIDYNKIKMKNKNEMKKTYEIFKRACKKQEINLLGKAATYSSLLNNNILKKDKLSEIIDMAYKLSCDGVNVAHSGTVIGVIYEEKKVDEQKLLYEFKRNFNKLYNDIYITHMIEGGVRFK